MRWIALAALLPLAANAADLTVEGTQVTSRHTIIWMTLETDEPEPAVIVTCYARTDDGQIVDDAVVPASTRNGPATLKVIFGKAAEKGSDVDCKVERL